MSGAIAAPASPSQGTEERREEHSGEQQAQQNDGQARHEQYDADLLPNAVKHGSLL
jgi:hypothetical protein